MNSSYLTNLLARSMRVILWVAVSAVLVLSLFTTGEGARHYGYLAQSFGRGVFSVNDLPANYVDKVVVAGNTFVPLAPMPAILLVPLVSAAGLPFDELWLGYLFSAFNVLMLFNSLKKISIPREQRRWLIAFFLCGTIYLNVWSNGRSWFLAHIVATFFLFLALNEILARQRAGLIGLWLGFAFLARAPTLFALPVFLWLLKPSESLAGGWRHWFARCVQLSLGLVLPMLFWAYYNVARFGSPFETGYAFAIVGERVLADALAYGLFSPAHIPKNLYALLLAGPQAYPSFSAPVLTFPYFYPSPWGMGIFFTTPAFVYAFVADVRTRFVRAAWMAVGLIALPLVTYYGVGWVQFGFRYAVDFYPFLFVLTALGIARHFDEKARALIFVSIAVNVWGAWWQLLGFRLLPMHLLGN